MSSEPQVERNVARVVVLAEYRARRMERRTEQCPVDTEPQPLTPAAIAHRERMLRHLARASSPKS